MISTAPLLRLYRMTPKRRRLLLQATITVAAASAAVALLPFRRAIRFGCVELGAAGEHALEDCVWAIGLASRRVPWRAKCIEQGLAVQRMLRSAGLDAILHYGARHHPESGKLEAHVWVTVGERVVIGGAEAAEFAPVATYP